MLKLGKQLAVVEVLLYLTASDTLVAQATVTYSIPPRHAAEQRHP
jgi:acyl-coenzyme A thioesterase PaaI-like protein